MSKRIKIAGTVFVQRTDGSAAPYQYAGSYSAPVLDRLGLLSFGWKATIKGVARQPEPRTVIVPTSGREVTSKFFTCRIEAALVEHLGGHVLSHAANSANGSTLSAPVSKTPPKRFVDTAELNG